jgi:antitoxin (DNA-binding transcriptional repressor) of toxin-antitoxin stability system
MKLSISEARRRLPQLVRQVKQDRGSVVQITVRDEVVAELRAALPQPEPGAAAKALLELMQKLPKHRGPRRNISGHVKDHLYGREA